MRTSFPVLFVVIIAAFAGLQAAESTASVEARGLRIVGPGYGDGHQGLRAFNWSVGSSLALLVQREAGGIIAVDRKKSAVSLRDDQGNDLMLEDGQRAHGAGIGMTPNISEDGKAVMLEVSGPQAPAADAKRLSVTGKVVLRCASQSTVHRNEQVALAVDSTVSAGDLTYTITEVGKPDWGDDPLEVTLHIETDDTQLKSVVFKDADGAVIESREGGTMRMTAFDNVRIDRSFTLKRQVDKATIELEVWTDMQEVAVPVDLSCGVGL